MKGLRPFFCFYGGKWRIAPKYPSPSHSIIVEPFAGAAGYSLRYPDRRVILYDLDPIIAELWRYLIKVTPQEILAIPNVGDDETVEDLAICEEARWLVGFWLNKGCSSPRRRPSAWMRSGIRPGSFWGTRVRQVIAGQVESIRHWVIHNRSHHFAPKKEATWFVDPPYENAGKHYRFGNNINYGQLAQWCRGRPGQVIVCENAGAKWLPFSSLASTKTTRKGILSHEVMSTWVDGPQQWSNQ